MGIVMSAKVIGRSIKVYSAEKIKISYALYEHNGTRTFYSLEINEEGPCGDESFRAEDITDDRKAALKLLTLFADEGVTACTAYDIICDMLPI